MSEKHHKPFIKLTDECGSETTYYSVVYEDFPEEFKKKAERRLKETEELRSRCLHELKDYMEDEGFKPVHEEYLLATLRLHKYNMDLSKKKLKNFLMRRQETIKMLAEIEKETIENMIDDMFFGAFPYRDQNGSVLVFNRANNLNPEKYEPQDISAVLIAFYLFLMKFPISSVGGFTYFGDCTGITYYIYYISKALKNFLFALASFPIRAARIDVFNENALCRWLTQMASTFIDSKVIDMISWHGDDFDNLDDFYDLNMLPVEFGGNLGTLSNEAYRQKLLDFIEELKKENIIG